MASGGWRVASGEWRVAGGESMSLSLAIGGLRIRQEHVKNPCFAPVGSVIRQTPTLNLMTF
ncbi:MAG: hypothetical protein ABIG63_11965 [Chloroflexota bacterium]